MFALSQPRSLVHICTLFGLYVIDEANVECHGFDAALVNTGSIRRTAPIGSPQSSIAEFECTSATRTMRPSSAGPSEMRRATAPRTWRWQGTCEPGRIPTDPVRGRRQSNASNRCHLPNVRPNQPDHRPGQGCGGQTANRAVRVRAQHGKLTGNVHKYWKTFQELEKCQGGFVWDWADTPCPS